MKRLVRIRTLRPRLCADRLLRVVLQRVFASCLARASGCGRARPGCQLRMQVLEGPDLLPDLTDPVGPCLCALSRAANHENYLNAMSLGRQTGKHENRPCGGRLPHAHAFSRQFYASPSKLVLARCGWPFTHTILFASAALRAEGEARLAAETTATPGRAGHSEDIT